MNILHRTITDGDVLSLIRKFLVSGVMVGETYEETTVGTPQGGLCDAIHKPPNA